MILWRLQRAALALACLIKIWRLLIMSILHLFILAWRSLTSLILLIWMILLRLMIDDCLLRLISRSRRLFAFILLKAIYRCLMSMRLLRSHSIRRCAACLCRMIIILFLSMICLLLAQMTLFLLIIAALRQAAALCLRMMSHLRLLAI